MILQLENIRGGYHKGTEILKGIDLQLQQGEVLAIIGQNGTGKSTLAKAIINILPFRKGIFTFNEKDITQLNTKQLNELGIVYFMQGGRVFPELSVKENMIFASLNNSNYKIDFEVFPSLQKNWLDDAGLLSGGERHQLALAMALAKEPKLLILDEPSAGLSPVASKKLYTILNSIKEDLEISILLIEQNIANAVDFSDRVAIMQQGAINSVLDSKDKEKTIKAIQNLYF